eukprot:CAMPEP_0171274400 /NCGR_PEP_ID=MMETSP0790-20130122/62794_1 /TAXON_ID=2925 /ORGANISM="Alexandrium catenella, Strain OF101" /LENGTH=224 /DNA_ID=CAMNT_0011743445 /DNA_START=71 /DNA_END=742 /DNA_ORIENTATION=-
MPGEARTSERANCMHLAAFEGLRPAALSRWRWQPPSATGDRTEGGRRLILDAHARVVQDGALHVGKGLPAAGARGRRALVACHGRPRPAAVAAAGEDARLEQRDVFHELVVPHLQFDDPTVLGLASLAVDVIALETTVFTAHLLPLGDELVPRRWAHQPMSGATIARPGGRSSKASSRKTTVGAGTIRPVQLNATLGRACHGIHHGMHGGLAREKDPREPTNPS